LDREGTVRFIALRGVEGKREYPVKGDRVQIGSAAADDPGTICIAGEGVLPRHALFVREGGSFRLEPEPGAVLVVNRRPFVGGPIHDGDQVAFGRALFQFWAGGLHGRAPRPYEPEGAGESSAGEKRAHVAGRGGGALVGRVLLAAIAALFVALLLVLLLRGIATAGGIP
jgi:hypothetical protein